jgi:N-acetylornithine carbamoyltransferase
MGMEVRVAAPPEFALPEFLVAEARAAATSGGAVHEFTDQRAAVRNSRVVYAKAWAAPGHYGDPAAGAAARARHADWTVTEDLMALGNSAVFLHCLPVRRNVVVADEVLDGPRSLVLEQAAARLDVQKATLCRALEVTP